MLRVRATTQGWEGGPGLHTAYFDPATEDAASALDAVTCVHSSLSYANNLFPSSWTAQVSGDVDVINPGTGTITNTISVTAPGLVSGAGGTGGLLPPATALNVRLSTAAFIAGRRLRGRVFLSPMTITAMDGAGTPTAAAIAYGMGYGGILKDNAGVAGPGVVWHRPVGGAGGECEPIASVTVPDKFAVLRSRRD